jgi:hypothetical protein
MWKARLMHLLKDSRIPSDFRLTCNKAKRVYISSSVISRHSVIGITRTCESCGHIWYINRKIRMCKCLTYSGAKRSTTERKIAHRIENQSYQKTGGPFWIRTRDPSLIRTVL